MPEGPRRMLVITTPSLPNAIQNQPYSFHMAATGGTPPYTWNSSAGLGTCGLSIDSTSGTISGTPSVLQTCSFTVTVSDTAASAATSPFTLSVVATLVITSTTFPPCIVGVPYQAQLTATGGTPPYGPSAGWSVIAGALPPGLSIQGSTISGICSTLGSTSLTFPFTLQVTDSQGKNASAATSIQSQNIPNTNIQGTHTVIQGTKVVIKP